ncbi:retrovirus-related pol polyprotein from transposon TNT 1-94 [Tanacetum coccineum]|uniref:Retrovirus-related pol polyprotein from transposon TNT 1-94 n=1 Tax=Tanacetum coccineum TaxID=301880 RepID=A0ABQ5AYI4_9ASTR
MQISQLKETRKEADRTLDFRALDFQITQLIEKVNVLQEQNELFGKRMKKYAIDVEPIPPRNRNNREVHLDYLKHFKKSVETLREIVEEAKVERPLDSSLAFACFYTKHSQELLKYVIGTCPKDFNQRDKNHAATPLTRKKQVTFKDQCETSNSNIHKHVEQLNIQKTNVPMPPSTGVNSCTDASGSQPRSNTKKNRILPAKSVNKKQVEEHPRTNKSSLKTTNHFDSSISYKRTVVQIVLWVYYVEGLGHNLFSVTKFYDSDLKVSLRKHSFEDMMKSSPICLLSKVSKNKSWLWHRRLNHLNFGTINDFARKDFVRVLPRLKFENGHLCSACQLGKSKKHTHTPKAENTNLDVLNNLHMDLCGPMRVQTINWKKYILVIVDDYSRFTWVKFLRSKDETLEVVIKFLKQNKSVSTKLLNKSVLIMAPKISSQASTIDWHCRKTKPYLVEAARTMLIFSKALMFLWVEAVATAFYTQN